MTLDDIAHMADQERKREREESRPAMVSIRFDVWEKERKECQRLREKLAQLNALVRKT